MPLKGAGAGATDLCCCWHCDRIPLTHGLDYVHLYVCSGVITDLTSLAYRKMRSFASQAVLLLRRMQDQWLERTCNLKNNTCADEPQMGDG